MTEENANEKSNVSLTDGFQILKRQIKELNEKMKSDRKDMRLLKTKIYNLDFENIKLKKDINKLIQLNLKIRN